MVQCYLYNLPFPKKEYQGGKKEDPLSGNTFENLPHNSTKFYDRSLVFHTPSPALRVPDGVDPVIDLNLNYHERAYKSGHRARGREHSFSF